MAGSALEQALDRCGVLVLDGAMATELERRGADLSGDLWSARVLLERPDLITSVHRDYFDAGADVAITASYQASLAGFTGLGLSSQQAESLIQRAVQLATGARDEFWRTAQQVDPELLRRRPRPLVATSVGPYGAVLADGSEYRGNYDVTYRDLVRFHRSRLAILVEAGVEVLAGETIPSLVEARALVEALADWPDLTAWISFSCRDTAEVSDGTALRDCGSFLHEQDQVVAVGVNCTAVSYISPLIRALCSVTDKPVLVYPNSGETYDAQRKVWLGNGSAADFGELAIQWRADGARMIGGCCRTSPADIRRVARALVRNGVGPGVA